MSRVAFCTLPRLAPYRARSRRNKLLPNPLVPATTRYSRAEGSSDVGCIKRGRAPKQCRTPALNPH